MLILDDVAAGHEPGHPVVQGVHLQLAPGRVLGLSGPSGAGKTTLARVAALLLAPERGTVTVDGIEVRGVRYDRPAPLRTAVAMVFQSPRRSVDPRFRLAELIGEPLRLRGLSTAGRAGAHRRHGLVSELAERVGLTPDVLVRRPHEVSDGQLQRACLARSLAAAPRYLVCDEMTAMLDASTAAALVGVVREEVVVNGLGVLAISHDDDLLGVWADDVLALAPPRR